jgi:hypothetical protein
MIVKEILGNGQEKEDKNHENDRETLVVNISQVSESIFRFHFTVFLVV